MGPCEPTATSTDATNKGFITRWGRIKQSREVEWRADDSDICNVPTHLLPGVQMQIKLTKTRREFHLNKDADSQVVFKFLEAQLLVKRVRPNTAYLVAQNTAIQAGAIAKYNLTRVELNTFTFSNGSQLVYR